MNKYAIFLDLDGTTLATHNSIDTQTKEVIQTVEAAGHKVFLATGRQLYGAIPFHQELQLDTPIITLNSGVIYTTDYQVMCKHTIDDAFINYLYHHPEYFKKFPDTFFEKANQTISTTAQIDPSHFFFTQMPEHLAPNFTIAEVDKHTVQTYHETMNILSFIEPEFVHHVPELVQDFMNDVSYRVSHTSTDTFCEFHAKDVSKASGIDYLMTTLDLKDTYKTMAFGDGLNDVEMLSFVDYGVAMKNAKPEVQAAADKITNKTNAESGVADYLQQILL